MRLTSSNWNSRDHSLPVVLLASVLLITSFVFVRPGIATEVEKTDPDLVVVTTEFRAAPNIDGGTDIAAALSDAFGGLLYQHPHILRNTDQGLANFEGNGRQANDFDPSTKEGQERLRHWGVDYVLVGDFALGTAGQLVLNLYESARDNAPVIISRPVRDVDGLESAVKELGRELFDRLEIILTESDKAFLDRRWFRTTAGLSAYGAGHVAHGRGDYAEAEKHFRTAAKLEPNVSDAHNYVGWALYASDQYAAAVPHFRRALVLQPKHFDARWGLIESLREEKQEEIAALELATLSIGQRNHRDVIISALKIAQEKNDFSLASQNLDQLEVKTGPGRYTQSVYSLHETKSAYTLAKKHPEILFPALKRRVETYGKLFGVDHPRMGVPLASLADQLRRQKQYVEAVRYYRKVLPIIERTNGEASFATARVLLSFSSVLISTKQLDEAEIHLRRTLPIYESTKGVESVETAAIIERLAIVLKATKKFDEALSLFSRSAKIFNKLANMRPENKATSHRGMADIYFQKKHFLDAKHEYKIALELLKNSKSPNLKIIALISRKIGISEMELSDYRSARHYLGQALQTMELVVGRNHPLTAVFINDFAIALEKEGKYSEAIVLFSEAFEIFRNSKGPKHEHTVTSSIGVARSLFGQGKFVEALDLLEQVFKISQTAQNLTIDTIRSIYLSLSTAHSALGNYDRAYSLAQTILTKLEKTSRPEDVHTAAINRQVGSLLVEKNGQHEEAQYFYEKAYKINKKELGSAHLDTLESFLYLAALQADLGNIDTAEKMFIESNEAFIHAFGKDHIETVNAQIYFAKFKLQTGQIQEARSIAENYLLVFLRTYGENNRRSIIAIQNLALIYKELGQSKLAILFSKRLVNAFQSVRGSFQVNIEDLDLKFLSSVQKHYHFLADLLIEKGRLTEAQQVLRMLKEKEYFDFIRRSATDGTRVTRAAYTPTEAEWIKRYEGISGRLTALGREEGKLIKKKKLGLTDVEETRLATVRADLKVASKAFRTFLRELMDGFKGLERARSNELVGKQLSDLRSHKGDLRDLGDGVVLVNYVMLEDKVHIMLTTGRAQLARTVKVKEKNLNKLIQRFRKALTDPRFDPRPAGKELHDLLLAPIAEDLKDAGAKVLMLSLDRTLRYLPFSALHDGQRYVAEKYSTALFSELTWSKLKDRPSENWKVAGLGLQKEIEGFKPLPAVGDELEGIVRRVSDDDDGVIPGIVRLDQAFTAKSMVDALDREYPVLHLASHFVLKPGNESNSFLLLGDGNKLSLAQIREEDYDFGSVDLLTLSACETGMTGNSADGREIEGFGVLAQRQGAKGVLATLWPVADRSTGTFMQEFYRLRQIGGEAGTTLTKAEALRQARLGFLRGSAKVASVEKIQPKRGRPYMQNGSRAGTFKTLTSAPYAHPYYWAPFILLGNWL